MINLLQGRRLVDLSVTLDNNPWTDPPPLLPNIEYQDHQQGWPEMAAMFPGLEKAQMPGEEAWASERLTVTPHNGTHMDAPWHYSSTTNGGEPAFGIDELPLEWCMRPGVRLDFRHVADGAILQPEDLQRELARIGYCLSPLDNQYRSRRPLRPAGLSPARLRHWSGGDAVAAGAGRTGCRHRRLELGCTLPLYPRTLSGQRRRRADLGGA